MNRHGNSRTHTCRRGGEFRAPTSPATPAFCWAVSPESPLTCERRPSGIRLAGRQLRAAGSSELPRFGNPFQELPETPQCRKPNRGLTFQDTAVRSFPENDNRFDTVARQKRKAAHCGMGADEKIREHACSHLTILAVWRRAWREAKRLG